MAQRRIAKPEHNHVRRETKWLFAMATALPVVSFFGGIGINSFMLAKDIAMIPYVDTKFANGMKYTDEKTEIIRKDAYEHSDMNRQMMALEIEKYGSSVKSLEVKIDAMGLNIDRLYKESMSERNIERRSHDH